jgi:hypothetical protein
LRAYQLFELVIIEFNAMPRPMALNIEESRPGAQIRRYSNKL